MGLEYIPPPVRQPTRPDVLDTFEAWCLDVRNLLYSEYLDLPAAQLEPLSCSGIAATTQREQVFQIKRALQAGIKPYISIKPYICTKPSKPPLRDVYDI